MTTSTAFLIGTSRGDGNTWGILRRANESLNLPIIDLAERNISYFDYEHKNIGDDFIPTVEELLKFETIGFVSPVYWYTVSAQMKTFLDRLSDLLGPRRDLGRQLRGKRTFLFATGTTEVDLPQGMEETIQLTSNYLGMKYLGAHYSRIINEVEFDPRVVQSIVCFVESMRETK